MIRALIVDDEVHARDELEALLADTGAIEIVGKCPDGLAALRAIKSERPDVIFLDIQMPVISGFELLSMIDEEIMPAVVFVTAYDEYALKAFEENALDYLLKPVESDRLARTVQKLEKILTRPAKTAYPPADITRIPCIATNRIKLVAVPQVEFVRSDVAGVYVVSADGEYFTELTLKVLESRTPLVRCHRQFLINIDRVDSIVLHENQAGHVQMKSGKAVPVSRRYMRKMKEDLGF